MQKAYYLSTPHLARSRTCVRERRAIHVLLIHSIFVAALILFFVSLLYVQYTYSVFVTKLTSSAVTHIEVSSG